MEKNNKSDVILAIAIRHRNHNSITVVDFVVVVVGFGLTPCARVARLCQQDLFYSRLRS